MKILALFVLLATPLWAFKGEEYWNGFQDAYTQGKVRNLYDYMGKLSDLKSDIVSQDMVDNELDEIDYRANSILYFTVTGGKYGFRSTPATLQEWEQHQKALVFVGVDAGTSFTNSSLYKNEKFYGILINNETKNYLEKCQNIISASRLLSSSYRSGWFLSSGDYNNEGEIEKILEGKEFLLLYYFGEIIHYNEKIKSYFSHNEYSEWYSIIPIKEFSPDNQGVKNIFINAEAVFTPELKEQVISNLRQISNYLQNHPDQLPPEDVFEFILSPLREDLIQSHIRDFNLADLFGELCGIPNFSKRLKPLRPMLVTLQTGATAQRKENGGVRLCDRGSVFDAGISLNFGTIKLGGDQTEEEFLQALQQLAPIKSVRYL